MSSSSAGGCFFDALLARSGPPDADERRLGAARGHAVRRFARRLWDGLLAHEQVVDR